MLTEANDGLIPLLALFRALLQLSQSANGPVERATCKCYMQNIPPSSRMASMVHITKVGTMPFSHISQTVHVGDRHNLDIPTMSLPLKSFLSGAMDERAQSASPRPHQRQKIRSASSPHTPVQALSVLPDRLNTVPPISISTQVNPLQPPPILDATETLLRAMPAVVKARTGSVLARGFVLKTDYYPNGMSLTNLYNLC